MSIRLRLTLWYSVILAVTLVVFGIAFYYFVNYNTYHVMKGKIAAQANAINITSSLDSFDNILIAPQSLLGDEELYIQVTNYKRGVYQQTSNLKRLDAKFEQPDPKTVSEDDEGFKHVTLGGQYPFVVYQHLLKQGNEVFGLLQVGAYSGTEDRYMSELRTTLIFSLIVVVLIAFTISLVLARQALRPIENVIQASNSIQNGSDLSMRIPRIGPNDELGRLTDTLNGMLGRIETTYNELDEAYKAQRRFVSDASHELRTPLTTIRGNIELLERMWPPALEAGPGEAAGAEDDAMPGVDARRMTMTREAMHDIAGEAKRMSNLVNDLLALARADAGYEMEKTVQPLLPLVEDVARRAQLLPRNADWKIGNLSAIDNVEVYAHADFLRQLLFIFVENAFKYTPSGHVELRATRSRDQAGIVIKDTGIGMSNEEVPHIFERFYRADESRGETSGTGLGLSIAKWIIDEHGGSVEVSTREGAGTTFTVWLPIAFHGTLNEV
ncbi:HAMP domain-containing histidine kinase [Paenibacillus lycopersici]|uniref:histidine kinase n=1 Tax=Paenibacillus lycopersici TaxID=2704462 RepID=A0A6C0FX63_9BACL|nr:HAMP domain-containing sensor histidine kinase [Paenibacillus lycopersici]QHT60071.1 HAMP domain-containing histidine kinase [Paenibacillus lycopersici]